MQLLENGTSVRKYLGVFQELCMIYILFCAFVAEYNLLQLYCTCYFLVDANFCWCVRRGSEEEIWTCEGRNNRGWRKPCNDEPCSLPPASNMVGWWQQIKYKNAICIVYVRYKYCLQNFSRNTRGGDYMEDLGIDKHDNINVCFKRLKTKSHYSNQFL
jgi:hypothetical protein